ncbi:membrane protein [Kitasatospora sp. MMS16-BH015]|uniref:GtrA family protein n=1 Tax=Kitasatospora sp. MMS16-BH015 TaxID=2018025 RepID=UPI000CA2CE01|nr:GtrA family protein [Kitasatospora sp. MMS16-BH015]AUG79648.1 membrane protein [Kitasatospora sp. MMS16-BH015]
MPSPTQRALALVPERVRPLLVRHRKLVKFLLVGGTCFVLTMVVNFALKLTVLKEKPVIALTIATVLATVVSYALNRQWAFRANGRQREAVLFFVVSGLAILVNDAPLALSRYVFDLREPDVSHFGQEVADFLSGMIVGTLLAMVFRYWAMKRWVFLPDTPPAPAGRPEPERVP